MSIDRHHVPRTPARRGPRPCAVAVLSAGSVPDRPLAPRAASVGAVLARWAALIQDRTGVAARPVCVVSHDPARLSAGLRGLPSEAGRFVVIRADRSRDMVCEGNGLPVVTDTAMTAVAVSAALLGMLGRRGLSPRRTRVLILGAATMPVLCPLLTTAGIGELISWDRRDADRFPLRRITGDVEVVIDLLGCGRELTAAAHGRSDLIIITPDATSWTLLALPGVLRALAAAPDPALDVEVYYACALALADASPPGRVLPAPTDLALGPAVERAAIRALRDAGSRRGPGIPVAPGHDVSRSAPPHRS